MGDTPDEPIPYKVPRREPSTYPEQEPVEVPEQPAVPLQPVRREPVPTGTDLRL